MEKGHYSVLRVSHLSQIGNFSIEQQKESIEAYATLHSIEITEHLAECGSGTTGERRQIQTLYQLISEDQVEGILCYKLDRNLSEYEALHRLYLPMCREGHQDP